MGQKGGVKKKVELLELGKAGGVYAMAWRTGGRQRQLRQGAGRRQMVKEVEVRVKVEDQEESEQTTVAVKEVGKVSLLKTVYTEVQMVFEKWRSAGHYVDQQDLIYECIGLTVYVYIYLSLYLFIFLSIYFPC